MDTRRGGCGKPLVTVVWFRVDVAKPRADLRRVFARLRGRVIANDTEAFRGEKGFVASGVYMESGLGVLAGRGRHSMMIGGKLGGEPPFVRLGRGRAGAYPLAQGFPLRCGRAPTASCGYETAAPALHALRPGGVRGGMRRRAHVRRLPQRRVVQHLRQGRPPDAQLAGGEVG